MRLYPPAWGLPREAVEDDEICGHRIPAGAMISLSQWVTHRHPEFWDDPEDFRPERFSPDQVAARHPFAYFPFGGGPRVCIGRNLALLEAPLILGQLLSRFRLRLAGPEPVPDTTFTLRPLGGLPMHLDRRG